MRKIYIYYLLIGLAITMASCSNNQDLGKMSKWDCTILCAEQSKVEEYVITYSDEKIFSRTGILSFQNQNDFDIVIHLLTNGQEERTTKLAAGGTSVFYQVAKDTEYTVGCHADVDEGTEIKLMVYDGDETEVYSLHREQKEL